MDNLQKGGLRRILELKQSSKIEQISYEKVPLSPILVFHMRGLYLNFIYDLNKQAEDVGLVKRSRLRRFFVKLKQRKVVRLIYRLLPALILLIVSRPAMANSYLNQEKNKSFSSDLILPVEQKRKISKRLLIGGLIVTMLTCSLGLYVLHLNSTPLPMSTKILLERQYGLYKIPPFISSARLYTSKPDLECNLTQLLNYMNILDGDSNFGTIPNRASTKNVLTLLFWKIDAILKVSSKLKLSNHPKLDIAQKTFQELCKKDTFLLMYCKKLLSTYYPAKVKNDSAAINLQLEMLKVLLSRTPD